MTRVGVVIAAYNSESTIVETLESLVAQDYQDWRAIVVDDASEDGTVAAVAPYLRDARIELICNDVNSGSGFSRNRALQLLDTDLIAVLDADDVCLPTRFARQVAAFDADPDLDVLGAQFDEFGSWGGPVAGFPWPTSDKDIRAALRHRMPVAHCVAMYKRDCAISAGGYDARLRRSQDFALMLRMKDAKFGALSTTELLYRTERPIRLRYVIQSGRGAFLARYRMQADESSSTPSRGRMAVNDLRSIVSWLRRRTRESVILGRMRQFRDRITP